VTVELFGPARALAGRATIDVALAEPADQPALLRALALAVPAFVGAILTPDGSDFIAPNLLLLDGVRAAGGVTFTSADRPCVLFLPSGG